MPSNLRAAKPPRVPVIFGCVVAVLLALITTALSVPVSAQRRERTPPASGWADTILVNGKIATMNEAQRFVEALAVKDGRIAAAGGNQQIERFSGPETKVMDQRTWILRYTLPKLVGHS